MRHHPRLLTGVVVASVVAGVAMIATNTFAASTQMPMGAGDQIQVSCPNRLSNTAKLADSETVNCAPNPATTTTTVAPPPTTSPTTTPPTTTGGGGGGSPPCPQFLTEPSATQAFCDTMSTDQAMPGSRTGSLDPVLWGVDRWTGNDNPSQNLVENWADSTQDQCGASLQVSNLDDVNVCGGQTVESSNDNTSISNLAMYPRQPFNFAGRTGVVEVNVSDNSESSHAAWPTLAISDQPVPNPWSDPAISSTGTDARNSIGVDLIGNSSSSPHCITGIIWATTNYQESTPGGSSGCALASSGVGQMNHVEMQVSATGVSVYMSDAGTSNMVLIAQANFAVPLTQGLVWLEDGHYNGNKFGNQQTDTFGWNDLAFDGPLEPRDLGFDVLDNTQAGPTTESGQPSTNIGYLVDDPGPATLTTAAGPTADQISAAAGAILLLTDTQVFTGRTTDLVYTVNGHQNTYDPPSNIIAAPVPLSELVPGPNTITVSYGDGTWGDVSNVDLILQGAGGVVAPS